ncbi:uncharacterized protein RAG0_10954 [Rhynchosporium agropyri]|uniref:Uncharacterized protein n=1 Tax=Rhynchosporium agropyri TaxID=914238 RepID=A0A1E1L1Z7_9HELO|nr:uncharacterized protein RAG0_10954 [Rhynchosporium agropyri]
MEGRELRLGWLRGLDGETYDTCASFEKQGSKLRIKVLDSATQKRNSSDKISKVGYKNFSSTAEDFVWDFITGNLLPNGETENGVSWTRAVVSAFFRLGYRVDMLSAYDAPRDVKNGNFISVLKSKMRIKPQSKLLGRSTQMSLATVY